MPSRNFLSLFGLDSDQDVRKTAIAAAREAYAVLPVQVGGKAPLCTLTTREFREVGPRHDCGVHHAITDPDHAGRVFTRLTKGSARINLGMVAGPSRLLVVDADTDEEVRAFLRDWADAEDDLGYLTHTPTVRTPGLLDDRGEWCHKNGGHFHFSLPDDVTLPWDVRGSVKAEGGYDVRWGMSQTLVPPSVRPEGPYRATGDILEAPTWLLDRARDAIDQAALRRLERAALTAHDGVARWSMSVSWSELLTRHGWHPTGKVERCGCAIWTKPGGGSTSYKSATAHEPDCLRYDSIEGHGPLHLWTTEPPAELMSYVLAGQQTITKLMFVAAMEYGGSIAEAMRGLGIDDLGPQVAEWLNDPSTSPDTCGPDASPDVFPGTRGASPAVGPRPQGMGGDAGDSSSNDGLVPESPSLGGGDPGTHDGEEQEEHRFWEPHELADEPFRTAVVESAKRVKVAQRGRDFLAWREAEFGGTETISTVLSIDLSQPAQPVTPDVAVRQDGVPLLYRSRVNTIFGPSESGKSWFSLACAVSVVRAGGSVLVVDMEDDLGGFLHRLRTVGVNQVEAQSFAYQRPWTLGDRERSVILAAARGRDLLVVDSMDAMTALLGVGEGALAIRSVGSILKQWAVMSGAAVLLVDHSKFGQRALCKVLDTKQIHEIITDRDAAADHLATLEQHGVAVRLPLGEFPPQEVSPHAS